MRTDQKCRGRRHICSDAAQERNEIRGANTGRSTSALEAPSAADIGLIISERPSGQLVHLIRLTVAPVTRLRMQGLIRLFAAGGRKSVGAAFCGTNDMGEGPL